MGRQGSQRLLGGIHWTGRRAAPRLLEQVAGGHSGRGRPALLRHARAKCPAGPPDPAGGIPWGVSRAGWFAGPPHPVPTASLHFLAAAPLPETQPCPESGRASSSQERICSGQGLCPKQGRCRDALLWVWSFYFHQEKKENVGRLLLDLPLLSVSLPGPSNHG